MGSWACPVTGDCRLMRVFISSALILFGVLICHGWDCRATRDVNMRSGPGVGYPVVVVVPGGARMDCQQAKGDWIKVVYGGASGYVYRDYVQGDEGLSVPRVVLLVALFVVVFFVSTFNFRRFYYRKIYLKSERWKIKRRMVLRRDNWKCVYCGAPASDVHHLKYAVRIGREPIDWLVSVCRSCHERQHGH